MTREEAIAYWKQRSEHIHNWLKENEDADFVAEYVEAIDMAIEALSADAVSLTGTMKYLTKPHNYCEVVRCKECQHRFYDKYNDCFMCDRHEYGESFEDDDYCSYGERKEK